MVWFSDLKFFFGVLTPICRQLRLHVDRGQCISHRFLSQSKAAYPDGDHYIIMPVNEILASRSGPALRNVL